MSNGDGASISSEGLLIDLGFSAVEALLSSFTKAKYPKEILDALQAALDAIQAHALDNMSKEQWESLRG